MNDDKLQGVPDEFFPRRPASKELKFLTSGVAGYLITSGSRVSSISTPISGSRMSGLKRAVTRASGSARIAAKKKKSSGWNGRECALRKRPTDSER